MSMAWRPCWCSTIASGVNGKPFLVVHGGDDVTCKTGISLFSEFIKKKNNENQPVVSDHLRTFGNKFV